jgi:8-oxo-dGTP pyrophosphatase MutT (NUDIX family)
MNYKSFFPALTEDKKKSPEVLKGTEWLSLMRMETPNGEYIYSHENRCNGNIVAILPYRRAGRDAWEFGVRKEVTPAWGLEAQFSSVTGGVDEGKDPKEMAVIELKEETGYICEAKDLESLGTCRGTKSVDTLYHLFAVDVTDLKKGEKSGDGSVYDTEAGFEMMVGKHELYKKVVDPIWFTMVMRLGL